MIVECMRILRLSIISAAALFLMMRASADVIITNDTMVTT